MPDLQDLLSSEADRLRPDRVPAFETVIGRRRRRRKQLATTCAVASLLALGVAAVAVPALRSADQSSLRQVPGSAQPAPAPAVLEVDCTPAGPTLPNGPRVAAQPDGVHYSFHNRTDAPMHIAYAMGGDTIGASTSRAVTTTRLAPSDPSSVSCSTDGETLSARQEPIHVEDPGHVYIPLPKCSGATATRDFVRPMQGDPVALTLQSYPRADVVGYPQASPRQIFTGSVLIGWEGAGTSWTPTDLTDCPGTVPHVVGSGITAPPPNELTHTDEFGLVSAVRASAGGLEVDVDRVDMLSGKAAEAAAAAAGAGAANDYFLRDDNATVRTYKLSPAAAIWGSIRMGLPEPWPSRTTLARWRDFIGTAAAEETLFHFQIEDGLVTGIEEQYRP